MKIDVFENDSYYDNENEPILSLAFERGQRAMNVIFFMKFVNLCRIVASTNGWLGEERPLWWALPLPDMRGV